MPKKTIKDYVNISIHALVKRATGDDCDDYDYYDISIHALVKRATFMRR